MSKEKHVKHTSEELKKLKDESDWDRAAGMTDEEKAVYAIFDEYVIEYFKKSGRGYQSRMNAVLKAYVDAQLEKRTP